MRNYKEFILKLTNKARQQKLGEIESGILRSEGQVTELQAENEQLKEDNERLKENLKYWQDDTKR